MAMTAAERVARYRDRHPERIAAYQKKSWHSYYEKNKEQIISRAVKWNLENPDKVKAIRRKHYAENKNKLNTAQQKYRKENAVKYLLGLARRRAKRLGRIFDVLPVDIVMPSVCPLLEIPINAYSEHQDFRPSIDRIDSSKGYIKGNVQIISHKENRIKSNACGDELMVMAINLLKVEGNLP